jgi:hypothetical protein
VIRLPKVARIGKIVCVPKELYSRDPSSSLLFCILSLNVGGPGISVCGKVGDHNYDLPPNAIGGIMPTVIQECYAPGSIIDVESQITAHHKGHFEMCACPIQHGEVPTQECFDSNPLTFISDELYGAVPDVNYPQRAYIPRTGENYISYSIEQ